MTTRPASLAGTKLPQPTAAGTKSPGAARWETIFGCPAPQRLPSLVEQAIAWREQVLTHGDVTPAIAHDLQLAAEHAFEQRGAAPAAGTVDVGDNCTASASTDRTAVSFDSEQTAADGDKLSQVSGTALSLSEPPKSAPRPGRAAPLPPAASQLLPGSQLVKAYGGRNHVVSVEEAGFRYESELFSSLSGVAKHITGTHWNGLLFFGLRKRRSYPPKPRRHG